MTYLKIRYVAHVKLKVIWAKKWRIWCVIMTNNDLHLHDQREMANAHHFFGEKIGRIDFSVNVIYGDFT